MALESNQNPERGDSDGSEPSTVERFFCGVCEFIFHSKLGVADVQLVDYVSDLMLRFVRSDSVYSLRQSDGRRTRHVVQMVSDAERRIGLAKREVYRHVGDFTLFWAGVYPESLANEKESAGGLIDYKAQGKRAYAIAAGIEGGEDRPPCDLIHRMSEQFEMCAYGLREVRRQWESGEDGRGLLLS
ncbi:MAG: hypothetical protein AAFX06_33070 [Planctomycetota bacterium]